MKVEISKPVSNNQFNNIDDLGGAPLFEYENELMGMPFAKLVIEADRFKNMEFAKLFEENK